jgi:hypothetical protein
MQKKEGGKQLYAAKRVPETAPFFANRAGQQFLNRT